MISEIEVHVMRGEDNELTCLLDLYNQKNEVEGQFQITEKLAEELMSMWKNFNERAD